MKRFMLKCSYIGTTYRGSQKISFSNILDIDSIQGAIESSLFHMKNMLKNDINLIMAGRTDSGVHALCSAAHIDLDLKPEYTIDTNQQIALINRNLIKCGHEIRVLSFHEVSQNFHARYSAKSRTYLYRILLSKNPNNHQIPISEYNRTLHIHSKKNFDIERVKNGIELFKGTRDFKTFTSLTKNSDFKKEIGKSFVRTLDIVLEEAVPLMPFDSNSQNFIYWNIIFISKSFLYNQIRRIVGTLIALGYNTVKEEDVIKMLQIPSHDNWDKRIRMAAPHGLYLSNVEYDSNDSREISSLD